MVQRGHHFAIVDEVDSILIDEARTPLIISGPSEESTDKYYQIDRIIPQPRARRGDRGQGRRQVHHRRLPGRREGPHRRRSPRRASSKVEKLLGIENLYDLENMELLHGVNQALRAHHLFKRDVDYLIKDGEVVIVDEFTGRMMPGRRWSDGLHQAVEAKEGVKIERENQTLATITFQNYFRMYKKLAGMTGTADTEAAEFGKIYKLDVVVIPTNQPMIREDHPDLVYRTARREVGRGGRGDRATATSAASRRWSAPSRSRRARCSRRCSSASAHPARRAQRQVPRARGRDRRPGRPQGRGHHRHQHGRPRHRHPARRQPRRPGARRGRPGDGAREAYDEALARYRETCARERDEVLAAGGLHILGTERHESRRIDNQLRGRSGRQGDPGSSRFYLSLEDDLMRIFGSDRIQGLMGRLGMEEGEPIEHGMVSRAIERAQKQVEGRNFEIRKHLLEYDDVMNKQREAIYQLRRDILDGKEGRDYVLGIANDIIDSLVDTHCPEKADAQRLEPLRARHRHARLLRHRASTAATSSSTSSASRSCASTSRAWSRRGTRRRRPASAPT